MSQMTGKLSQQSTFKRFYNFDVLHSFLQCNDRSEKRPNIVQKTPSSHPPGDNTTVTTPMRCDLGYRRHGQTQRRTRR
jgi:hypothetical protein